MAFDFSCPMCKHIIQVDNSAVGEMGVCPKCGAEVSIQRSPVDSESEQAQNQQDEQLSDTSPSSMPDGIVELGTGTTIAARIVLILVFLCIISSGGYFIYTGFELFGYKYEGVAGLMEDKTETGLSEHQKKLLKQTEESQGQPDYSHLAIDLPERTEEELRIDASLGASGGNDGGFGGAPTGGNGGGNGESRDGQGSGRRSFDPESIFAERDKDEDGFLSGDEISERMRSRVEAMDEDKDGAISKEEFIAAMDRFRSSRQGGGGDAPRGNENE